MIVHFVSRSSEPYSPSFYESIKGNEDREGRRESTAAEIFFQGSGNVGFLRFCSGFRGLRSGKGGKYGNSHFASHESETNKSAALRPSFGDDSRTLGCQRAQYAIHACCVAQRRLFLRGDRCSLCSENRSSHRRVERREFWLESQARGGFGWVVIDFFTI